MTSFYTLIGNIFPLFRLLCIFYFRINFAWLQISSSVNFNYQWKFDILIIPGLWVRVPGSLVIMPLLCVTHCMHSINQHMSESFTKKSSLLSVGNLYCFILALLLAMCGTVGSQRYSKEERGMPISMFRFDPATLGIYNHAQANRDSYNRKKFTFPSSHGFKKGAVHKEILKKNTTAERLLSSNPSPNDVDAKKHLDNVKFDTSSFRSNQSLIRPANLTSSLFNTNTTFNNRNTTFNNRNATTELSNTTTKLINNQTSNDIKPTKELLFFRNKTSLPSEHAERINSVKLTKSTPPERNTSVPILKVCNSTACNTTAFNTTAFNLTSFNATSFTQNNNSTKNETAANNTSSALQSNMNVVNNTRPLSSNNTQKRDAIIAQYIPFANMSYESDNAEGFQAGSRKHKLHQMFPQCYHCPKNSNYTDCVMKSKLVKCDTGLNNICFARSFKKKEEERVTYEMGCINHRQCLKARPFPCRGKHCLFPI